MEKLIVEIYEKKLHDGSIEKIISDKIDQAVSGVVGEMFGYAGEGRQILKDKIAPVMLQAIESSDLGAMVGKITALINAGMSNSALTSYHDTLENLHKIFGQNDVLAKYKGRKSISLREIFSEYVKSVETDIEKDDFENWEITEYGGHRCAEVPCFMSIERDISFNNQPFFTVTFANEKSESQIAFKTFELSTGSYYMSCLYTDQMTLQQLRYCSGFQLFIFALERELIRITGPFKGAEEVITVYFDE